MTAFASVAPLASLAPTRFTERMMPRRIRSAACVISITNQIGVLRYQPVERQARTARADLKSQGR